MTPQPSGSGAPPTGSNPPKPTIASASPPAGAKDFSISDSDEAELLGSSSPTEPSVVKAPEPEKGKEPAKEPGKEVVKKDDKALERREDGTFKAKEGDVEVVEKEEGEPTAPNLLKTLDEKRKSAARDYTGFADEEVKALKSMSNEAFNYVAPLLKTRKELEKLKDATFLQHPESYVLHPAYQEGQELLARAGREAQEWQKALISIRKGEEWAPLVGLDRNGNFVYGEKRKPNVEDEEQVRASMNKCLSTEQAAAERLKQLPQQFQQQIAQDNQGIQAERAKRFDWVANPELLKHEIDTPQGKLTVGSIRDSFVSLFPVYHQRSPGVEVAADLWVAMQVLQARLELAEKGKAVAEVLKEEAARVEPTSGIRSPKGGSGKNGIKEFNLDGMPE